MAKEVYLAVDLGAESGRAMACLFDGQRIELQEIHRFLNVPVRAGEHLYWDVLRLWHEIKTGLAKAYHTYGESLKSVGVDTWGVDYGLLDERRDLIGNPYHYRDHRTEGMMDAVFEIVPREQVFHRTGIQFMRLNSLFQIYSMVRSRHPQLQIAKQLLFMPDIFHYWLSGVRANEFTIATTSQCFDPRAGDWAVDMLQVLGIDPQWFSPVRMPATRLGDLASLVVSELGIGASQVQIVLPASHDTGSAVAAAPLSGANAAYLSSGTWSLLGIEVPQPVINGTSLQYNFTNEGGAFGTYRLLKNVMGLWLVQECRRAFARSSTDYSYEQLTELAEQSEPLRSFVDPDDPLFLAPESMPDAIRAYCLRTGQPAPQTEGEFVRCALESLALKYRWVLECLEALLGGIPIRTLHIVGGGSQNRLLNQWTADATGREVVAGPVEATAAGNALLQAAGLGRVTDAEELRQIVRQSFTLEHYEPQNQERWDEAYQRFASLLS